MTERELLRRVTSIEVAIKRLQLAMGGIVEALNVAQVVVISCDRCGTDMAKVETCEFEDCPCGVPTEKPDD